MRSFYVINSVKMNRANMQLTSKHRSSASALPVQSDSIVKVRRHLQDTGGNTGSAPGLSFSPFFIFKHKLQFLSAVNTDKNVYSSLIVSVSQPIFYDFLVWQF